MAVKTGRRDRTGGADGNGGESQRLDRWLHVARLMKTRALAAALARSGRLRLDGVHVRKPGQRVRRGQVLTFVKAGRVLSVRVLGFAPRRLPAREAVLLYEDLSPPPAEREGAGTTDAPCGRAGGAPAPERRPDKRQRRALRRWKQRGGRRDTGTDEE